ncbi:MAG: hypothetical protein WA101_01205 [Minisyncoccia bacterium]
MIKINKKNYGYVLLETVFYVCFFVILSTAVISAMVTMFKSYKETVIQTELERSSVILDKISREIRQATGINSINNDGNNLVINTKDDVDADKTVEFLISGSDLQIKENDILIGNLNTPNIIVNDLSFVQIATAKGNAVKIFLSVSSVFDSSNRIENFYNTVVLRGNY